MEDDALVTLTEAAERLGVSIKTIRKWVEKRTLASVGVIRTPGSRGRPANLYRWSDVLKAEARARTAGSAWDRTRR